MKPSLQHRQKVLSLGLLALTLVALAGVFAHGNALRYFLADTARRGDSTMQLAAISLRGEMERYEHLPELIAQYAIIRDLAASPEDPAMVSRANAYLKDTQILLGASDIYFMDLTGRTRAASNFDTPISFVDGNFAYRPYFFNAVQGGAGRFYALGNNSGKRGYYFGAPVRVGGQIAGVLVVKIDLDAIERAWRGGDYEVVVTDPSGILFLSSNPEWLFTALTPLTPTQRAGLAETRRYLDQPLPPFPLQRASQRYDQHLMRVGAGNAARDYLALEQPMPEADWTLRVLVETASARRQALTAAVLVMLSLGLGGMGLAVVLQRRARLRERLHLQQEARSHLERRVEERTRELAAVNRQLEGEVTERRQAEENLRQAQDDLIQAGKLAALGQMSAALSHEFNQPLGAARTFADNALVLLDRGREAEARGNLARIQSLIDRMSAISKHLRSFARAPGRRLSLVSLPEAVEAALEIAHLRLGAVGADLTIDIPKDLPRVVAGPVRLQQVLLNLLTNAADAVEGGADRRVHLAAQIQGDIVRITLRDHGPGVPQELTDRIFDPFFSTKGVGDGLGLGLSISFNIVKDFGGYLRVEAAPGGGALFIIELHTDLAAILGQAAQ
jgi:two-component system, NtrC family, C4-dicarboxylate transport sensor histidine kinase DctB